MIKKNENLYIPVYFVLGSVTNYGREMKDVHCSPKQVMVISSVNYGDFRTNGVFHDDENVDRTCSALATCRVKSHCNGKRSCELTVNSNLLPSEHCSGTTKQIYTKYSCKDTYNSSGAGKVNLNQIYQ